MSFIIGKLYLIFRIFLKKKKDHKKEKQGISFRAMAHSWFKGLPDFHE